MCQTGHTVFLESCNACKSLKSEWYQYLNNTGFIDAEDSNGDFIDDKFQAARRSAHIDFNTQIQFDAKFSYYQWAREKLNYGEFRSDTDKLIWEYHSKGLSTRDISPRIGLEQSWTARKVARIKTYLKDPLAIIGSVSYAIA